MGKLQSSIGRQTESMSKKVIIIALGGALLAQPAAALLPGTWHAATIESAAAATTTTLKLQKQSYVTAGAKRLDYVYSTTRSSKKVQTDVHVIEVDLSNPYVSLNVMSGKNNSIGQVNSILNMAKENGAVAGINADVFVMKNEGAPLGAQVSKGIVMSGPATLQGMYAFSVSKDRKPWIDLYTFDGLVTAADGATFPIQSINESAYSPEGTDTIYSHLDKMFIYTSAWGGAERPINSSTKPTEVLVRGGVIEAISFNEAISGKVPEDGYILRTHGTAATFVKEHLKVGDAITADYALVSQTTKQKVDASSLEMLVGGHTLLVNNGAASAFSRDTAGVSGSSYTSRSGVGYSKDGKKVYLITAERYGTNTGVSLKELQQIMVELGVDKGVNLDGGGSTTMVERPLGVSWLQLSHSTQYGTTQRSVANGIGVFTSAPKGDIKGVSILGSQTVPMGVPVSFTLRGYDTYYNPMALDSAAMIWSADKAAGSFTGNTFTGSKTGKTTIKVQAGGITTAYDIEVVGKDQVSSLSINTPAGSLVAGAATSVPLTLNLKNGESYKLSADYVKWQYIGFEATRSGDTITVTNVKPDVTVGYAIARYDGFAEMIPFTVGQTESVFADFETSSYAITSQVTPAETTGRVKLVSDLPNQPSSRALQIDYDFTNASGTKASYAVFGSSGVTLSGSPISLTMDLYGDNSKNWVRAEFTDADGKNYMLDVTKQLDWSGWKNVKVNLSASGMKYPVKLKRVYVVSIEDGQESRALSGTIGLDNIKLQYTPAAAVTTKAAIEMQLDNASAKVDGKTVKLDSAPLAKDSVTYVPLRFVTDAMGGRLLYDSKLGRVTLLRGTTLLELTLGKKEINVNGVLQSASAAPIIKNNRTLVPIRLISEKLGFKVQYDSKTKKITID
jgi:exopolysaccharide biosynthesis protein